MSSEEEDVDEQGPYFKVSKLPWRAGDITKMMRKSDELRRNKLGNKGPRPSRRKQGDDSKRGPVKNLRLMFYERLFVEKSVEDGELVMRNERREDPNWMDYHTWLRGMSGQAIR